MVDRHFVGTVRQERESLFPTSTPGRCVEQRCPPEFRIQLLGIIGDQSGWSRTSGCRNCAWFYEDENIIEERLEMYTREQVEVRILGLTRDQVDQFDPPLNFAKETDKRYPAYLAERGPHCWELDALPPDEFDRLVRAEIESELDLAAWKRALTSNQLGGIASRMVQDPFDGCLEQIASPVQGSATA